MKTKLWAIALMILCTLFTAIGQILYKVAVNSFTSFSILAIITNIHLILGLMSYGIGLVLLIVALKGGEVSVLYPIIALSYIWVSIMSPIFFNTDFMTLSKWIGVIAIFIGVAMIGWGADK